MQPFAVTTTQPATLKESRRHGNERFPLALYRMQTASGETVLDSHWHEEAEFLVVLEGETLFQIGSRFYPLQQGEAIFIHSGEVHAGFARGGAGCQYCAVVFDMNWLRSGSFDLLQEQFMQPLIEGRRSLPAHITGRSPWGKKVLRELNQIVDLLARRPPGFPLAVKSRFYAILAEIAGENRWVRRHMDDDRQNYDLERLKQVLVYIEHHYDQKIGLPQLAQIAHMSEGHFCRFFKAMTRKTSIQYINSYRISRAAELLQTSERKISDIAGSVGFDNISYFVKTFKKLTGYTPEAYRKHVARRDPH